MASGDSMKKLCLELACPICLEYFKEPVMIISCGHHFCQSCLDQCWEGKEASCPQCREKVQEGDIRPNRQLANLVEIAKELGSQKAEEKGRVCQRHQEPLKLFCKNHEAPICVVCDRSKEHKNHKVIPLDEASKEYKDQIGNLLETLKKEREKILACKADAARESQDVLGKIQREKDKAVAAFRLMYQFLEEQEKILLAKMEEVEKEISAKGDEHLARLSEELSSLSKLIQEMEEKHQQPASELLQDIKSVLQGYKEKEKFEIPVAFPPSLKWNILDICDINPFLEGIMKPFKDSLESGLHQQKGKQERFSSEGVCHGLPSEAERVGLAQGHPRAFHCRGRIRTLVSKSPPSPTLSLRCHADSNYNCLCLLLLASREKSGLI
uniref:Zinc finger protein RFP-like n=1 Tax=Anolis carolinensis TaxID=28377 RepID=A0A803TWU5_ANOCA